MDKEFPIQSTCRHCNKPITWDDWSYVHDSSGFADCNMIITGGTLVPWDEQTLLRIDPDITQKPKTTTFAEPKEA